jgi:hypothetical protein
VITIGIDPHKVLLTAVAVDPSGRPLGRRRLLVHPGTLGQLVAWAAGWPARRFPVEGASGHGAALEWPERPLEHPHAGLAGQPARLAHRPTAPRLCPRAEPVEYLCANLKMSSWRIGPRPPWSRSPTPLNKASSGSASTRTWSSGSWLTPASLSTREPSTQPRNSKNSLVRVFRWAHDRWAWVPLREVDGQSVGTGCIAARG